MLREAFPDFGILLSVTGSEEYWRRVEGFSIEQGIELLPPPDLTGIEEYRDKIEVGFVGILDLLRELGTREFIGAVYLESDLYPIHKNVSLRVKERLQATDCVCLPRSYAPRLTGFLSEISLVKAWGQWFGRTPAIQSPNFILGLNKRSVDLINAELDSTSGRAFMQKFKEVTKIRSTDASKWLLEVLLTTILRKHDAQLGPTWDDVHEDARHTLQNQGQFLQRLHDPGVYFMHQLKPGLYPEVEEDFQTLYEFWGVLPKTKIISSEEVTLDTNYPVAVDSPDHTHPWGTKHDNSTNKAFIDDVLRYFDRPIRMLDLGCSGGQLAVDFNKRGSLGVGLEGSDYSLAHERPNWVEFHDKRLFTCDISQTFQIYIDGEPAKFDCITAWEVTEHIHPDLLFKYFENIHRHLAPGGVFIGSVAMFLDDTRHGPQVHQSVFSEKIWRGTYFDKYFEEISPITTNYVRTSHCGFYHCCIRREV
jgi:SAM-dependent methyltransferase